MSLAPKKILVALNDAALERQVISAIPPETNVLRTKLTSPRELLSREKFDLLIIDADEHRDLFKTFRNLPFSRKVSLLLISSNPSLAQHAEHAQPAWLVRKPVSLSELRHKITHALNTHLEGYLKGLSLPSLLQIAEMEEKTGTITVKNKHNVAKIFLVKGLIVHAETALSQGIEAAIEALTWEFPEIYISATCNPPKFTLRHSPLMLTLEAMKRKDEREHNKK